MQYTSYWLTDRLADWQTDWLIYPKLRVECFESDFNSIAVELVSFDYHILDEDDNIAGSALDGKDYTSSLFMICLIGLKVGVSIPSFVDSILYKIYRSKISSKHSSSNYLELKKNMGLHRRVGGSLSTSSFCSLVRHLVWKSSIVSWAVFSLSVLAQFVSRL